MAVLQIFVDFDNVELSIRAAGPVTLARLLLSLVPTSILMRHDSVSVRLYGGWRAGGNLTNSAQRLIPEIRSLSPADFPYTDASERLHIAFTVELADRPLGRSAVLEETFVRERSLRKFRARRQPWKNCQGSGCGFDQFAGLTSEDACTTKNCSVRLVDLLVRDEQKMVDTLMVADIAKAALVDRCTDVILVSSDTDMWPGLLLALHAGCYVTHIHTRQGGTTQRHLLRTLDGPLARFYHHASP